jgi:hypothetical protein
MMGAAAAADAPTAATKTDAITIFFTGGSSERLRAHLSR